MIRSLLPMTIVAGFALTALAQQDPSQRRQRDRQAANSGPNSWVWVSRMLDHMVDELQLDEQQRKEYRVIAEAKRERIRRLDLVWSEVLRAEREGDRIRAAELRAGMGEWRPEDTFSEVLDEIEPILDEVQYEWLIDLRQQLWQNRPVMHIARGQLVGQDHTRGLIHPQVQFAPQAASGGPMLANFPFALAEHLQPRAVHQQMNRARSTGANRYVQPGRPAAQRGVMRHRQARQKLVREARQKALRLAKGQAEYCPQAQRTADRNVTVNAPLATARTPSPGHFIAQPERHRPPLNQGTVVFRPIGHAVARFRDGLLRACSEFLGHP